MLKVMKGNLHFAASYQVMLPGTDFDFTYSFGSIPLLLYARKPIKAPASFNVAYVFTVLLSFLHTYAEVHCIESLFYSKLFGFAF